MSGNVRAPRRRVARRQLIAGGAALGGALLAACGSDSDERASTPPGNSTAAETPKTGGTLKLPIIFTSCHFDIHQFQTGYQMGIWRCCANGRFTFGVVPPTPSRGYMLGVEGRRFLTTAPWLAIFPGAAIALAVLAVNLFADALRDVLDPRTTRWR